MEQRPIMVNGRTGYDNYLDYLTRTARYVTDAGHDHNNSQQPPLLAAHPGDTHLDGSLPATTGATPPDSVSMASSGATQGELLSVTMVKGADGFGFTIADSLTGQRVKQVLEPQGCPGLCEGDVIVYINDVCVLGTTHADVVKLFQSVPIGQSVTLVLCRGYPLPYDPEDAANTNNTTTTTTIISPLGIMEQRPIMVNGRTGYDNYLDYLTRTARYVTDAGHDHNNSQQPPLLAAHPGDTHLDGSLQATTGATPPDSVSMASSGATQGELLSVTMVKGADGFGFTIADSLTGQRVKQVLEPQGCPGLCEGDLILEINKQPVAGFNHTQVVELLKECAVGAEASLVVQRGGHYSPWKTPKQVLEQWESQQGQNSPAQTSRSAPVFSHSAPFPTHHLHRASVPDAEALPLAKPDPYDLFEKSMAIYESRRKYRSGESTHVADGETPGSEILPRLPPLAGESCPENSRSPGSVSTQHSSPHSDYTYGNSTSTNLAPNSSMGNATATSDGTSAANAKPSDVSISRKESEGFGFVIISSLNRPETILIGAIIEKSPADLDGRLRPGDELLFVDGIPVVGKPHRYVIDLMHAAGRNGQVNLVIRRRMQRHIQSFGQGGFCRQGQELSLYLLLLFRAHIHLHPRPNPTAVPHKIGRIIEGSPADRSGKLKVGDQIIEINGESTRDMTHARAIELIKSGGRRVRLLLKRGTGQVPEYDNAAPWDGRPSASPSLSEVGPPIDSLSMPTPSSHVAPASDPPHVPPQNAVARDGQTERSKSPQKAELLLNRDLLVQGRRMAASGGSGRAKTDGGRSTRKGHRMQHATDGEGDKEGQGGEAKPSRSTRGRSKERTHSLSSSKIPHTNGNSGGSAERRGKARLRDLDGDLGDSRPGKSTSSSGGGTTAGRKATVSPGPWKIPGSDKLPSTLRAGASTLSR
uniref:Membrane associated guanylate kinase, WW and PDZ domain containing 2a n=1 Tax=Fundulus heteroclitus TaxID=8078 RepID=A0A3Q2TJV9_FUNHE